ncbi:hypothetical protein JCM17961_27170 [Endothiovibrio diazotrophicus]
MVAVGDGDGGAGLDAAGGGAEGVVAVGGGLGGDGAGRRGGRRLGIEVQGEGALAAVAGGIDGVQAERVDPLAEGEGVAEVEGLVEGQGGAVEGGWAASLSWPRRGWRGWLVSRPSAGCSTVMVGGTVSMVRWRSAGSARLPA